MIRKDREITDRKEILDIAGSAKVMRIAFFDEEYPYVLPFNFGYEEYLEKKQSAEAANNIVTTVEKSEPRVNNNPGKERSKLERKQKKLEEKLEAEENRISELKDQLLNPDIQSDYMKLSEIQTLIDEIEEETLADMAEWDELDAQIRDLS